MFSSPCESFGYMYVTHADGYFDYVRKLVDLINLWEVELQDKIVFQLMIKISDSELSSNDYLCIVFVLG